MRKLIAGLVAACLCVTSLPAGIAVADSFSDVPESHWSYQYVEKAAQQALVNGTGGGLFHPEGVVSNAEWATMICNLFYADSVESFKKNGGRQETWWMPYVFVARDSVFMNTALGNAWNGDTLVWDAAIVEGSISRYDMALVVYYVAMRQGWREYEYVVPQDSKDRIADYASVPEEYQQAVAYSFASGFVTGTDANGTFAGNDSMTRGAAAAVLCRLLDGKNGTHDFNAGADTVNAEKEPAAALGVAQRLTIHEVGTFGVKGDWKKYRVTVAGDAIAGKLGNGTDITEENILAMLAELEEIFPHGTPWSGHETGPFQGDYYSHTTAAWGNGGGCLSWVGMVADLLYGRGAAYTTHHDLSAVKIGDVVHLYNAETGSEHWQVVTKTFSYIGDTAEKGEGNDYFITCDGNSNGKVSWQGNQNAASISKRSPDSIVYSFY